MPLTVHLNRDSVHPGDDLESHASTIQVESQVSIGEVLEQVKRSYLPGIAGGQATWIISCSGKGPSPLGVLAQQWKEPKLRVSLSVVVSEVLDTTRPSLTFDYWCQKDPDLVFNRIAAGKEPPPR
ncbi:hypothetical protein GCM10027046_34220 [Uliginosibacterium flavum]